MACSRAAVGGTGMGIGRLGDDDILHKRKFRFLLEIYFCNYGRYVPPHFVKTAARPDITIDETEINFLNEKTWIPGKGAWEQVTITYNDVATDDNIELFSWLATVYDFVDDTCRHQNARRSDYSGNMFLYLLDGCGNMLETWYMGDAWPTSVKFGDLDYASSDICDIELSVRYSKVRYTSHCGGSITRCPCTPCSGSTSSTSSLSSGG